MRLLVVSFFAGLVAAAFVSAPHAQINISIGGKDSVKGSGTSATESRNVPSFTGVSMTGTGTLILRAGEAQSVKITADDNLLPLFKTEVKNGVLEISNERGMRTRSKIVFEITAPKIDRVENSGALSVNAKGFAGGALKVVHSGTGSVELEGAVDSLELDLSGVGSANTAKLVAGKVTAYVSGVGSADIRAEKSLRASVSGVGSVKWRGAATDVKTDVSGVGSVKKI
jgi:hypothetical protein